MLQPPKNPCPLRNLITIAIIGLGLLFLLTACASMYEKLGMTPDQVHEQVAADNVLKEQILDQTRSTTGQLITTALAGFGAIASGILAKWLGTERKINTVLITGIEKAKNPDVKKAVQAKALAAGVETKLNKRVLALT